MDTENARAHIRHIAKSDEAQGLDPEFLEFLDSVQAQGTPVYLNRVAQLLLQWARGLLSDNEIIDKIMNGESDR